MKFRTIIFSIHHFLTLTNAISKIATNICLFLAATVILAGCEPQPEQKTSTSPSTASSSEDAEASSQHKQNAAEPNKTSDVWRMPESPDAATYFQECLAQYSSASSLYKKLDNSETAFAPTALVDSIDQLEIILDKALGKASLYRNVHPDKNIREAADRCQQNFISLISDINLSKNIYLRLTKIPSGSISNSLDKLYIKDLIKDYKRSGVSLDQKAQAKIRELHNQINELGQKFNQNIRDDVRYIELTEDELKGLPADYIAAKLKAAEENEGVIKISTDYPDYIPYSQYAENDAKRKELYIAFRQRGYPKNEKILKSLLDKRYALAQTLGYENHAHFSMEELMIKTPENARNFVTKVSELAKSASNRDVNVLLKRLQEIDPKATQVGDWQKTYLENLVKKENFSVDTQEIREYFSYGKVQQGIFDLTETMFNVEIKPSTEATWHPSVNAYHIFDQGKSIGKFFLDMHPREGKYKHAAAFTLQDGVKGKQLPILALVCNFPGENNPDALMEHTQVETFLHEFGHLLHGIFAGNQARVYYSGIKTERDFVEAPSQMLEEWVWDSDTLKSFARNSKGETIPDSLIKRMRAGRDFGRGYWTKHQMFYASISLDYYDKAPSQVDMINVMKNNQNAYSPFPYVENTFFHNSFGHLYGYSSNYYTYMWSLVIANDMFSEFKKAGLRNPSIAQRYREKVLAPGGSKDAAELVKEFLGREYSFDAFEKSLAK